MTWPVAGPVRLTGAVVDAINDHRAMVVMEFDAQAHDVPAEGATIIEGVDFGAET